MDAHYPTPEPPMPSRARPFRRRQTDAPFQRGSGGGALCGPGEASGGVGALPGASDVAGRGELKHGRWASVVRRRARPLVRWGEHLLLLVLALFALLVVVEY